MSETAERIVTIFGGAKCREGDPEYAQAIQAVSRAGYSTAVTTSVSSTMHSMADRYAWGRVRVGGGESLQEFITNLGPNMPSTTISTLDVEPS